MTLQYNILHCITIHCVALHCSTLYYITLQYNTLHALHDNTIHCIAFHYNTLHCMTARCNAIHCITFQYNILHCISSHRITSHYINTYVDIEYQQWHINQSTNQFYLILFDLYLIWSYLCVYIYPHVYSNPQIDRILGLTWKTSSEHIIELPRWKHFSASFYVYVFIYIWSPPPRPPDMLFVLWFTI